MYEWSLRITLFYIHLTICYSLLGAPNVQTLQTIDKINLFIKDGIEVLWMFMELHIKKFILTLIMVISISEVSKTVLIILGKCMQISFVIHFNLQVNAIHLIFVISAVVAMMLNAALQDILIRLTSVTAAVVLLLQMVFQIKHFTVDQWAVTCEVDSFYILFLFIFLCLTTEV